MLTARVIPLVSIQHMDYIEILNFSGDLSTTYFVVSVGVELLLCAVVIPSQNAITCFLKSS